MSSQWSQRKFFTYCPLKTSIKLTRPPRIFNTIKKFKCQKKRSSYFYYIFKCNLNSNYVRYFVNRQQNDDIVIMKQKDLMKIFTDNSCINVNKKNLSRLRDNYSVSKKTTLLYVPREWKIRAEEAFRKLKF